MTLKSLARELIPHSIRLKLNVQDALRHGEPELHMLAALCDPDRTSLDVGACRGVYASRMQDYSSRVVAFEPQPYYADFVKKALRRVQVVECAVSDHEADTLLTVPVEINDAGLAYIGTQTSPPAHPTRQIKVRSLAIDSLKLSGIGFMKIDVEGHELAVLRGGEGTIARDLPNLLIEAEERHRKDAVASVSAFLNAYGYSGWFLSRGALHPVEAFDPRLHQTPDALAARSRDGSPDDPPYINNFMFVQPRSIPALQAIVRRLR